ncbi:MAG TPA: protein imuA [Caulobacteraceae bacterium]|nr:protein imuA [Caulobacteraceae bacterium]
MAAPAQNLAALRAEIAALEGAGKGACEVASLGDARLDSLLPGGGLGLKAWHEFAGEGLELETAAASAAFVARLAIPLTRRGELIWVLRRDDLHAPGLCTLGFPAERLIQVCARDEAEALAVMEDALRTPGVAAVFAEAAEVDLVAGRRLQLAAEQGQATGFLLRRRPFGGANRKQLSSAAATRWTIAPAPSEPAPGEPGLGAPRWRVRLERCRGGRTGEWILEAREEDDAPHPFRLVAELADRDVAAEERFQLAG